MLAQINDFIWSYILIALLIACGLWFTWKTKFIQFRMFGEMIRLLKDSGSRNSETDDDDSYYGREDIKKLCQNAGLHMESFEKRGFCRMHSVMRKIR